MALDHKHASVLILKAKWRVPPREYKIVIWLASEAGLHRIIGAAAGRIIAASGIASPTRGAALQHSVFARYRA